MSYTRLVAKEEQIEAEIADLETKAAGLLVDAEQTDTAEDAQYGKDGKDTELPAELDRRENRLARLHAARAQIEAEATEKALAHCPGRHSAADLWDVGADDDVCLRPCRALIR